MVFRSLPVRPFQHDFNIRALIFFTSCSPLCCDTADLFTFLIILVTVRGPTTNRFPGVPSILDAILRDATVYFLLVATAQLLLFFSTLFAPVGDLYHIEGRSVLLCSSLVHISDANSNPAWDVGFLSPLNQKVADTQLWFS